MREKQSELWKGVRKGVGWMIGAGTVVSAAALLREGPRRAIKAAMKAGIRGTEVAAEIGEQLRDFWAEVQVEQNAEPHEFPIGISACRRTSFQLLRRPLTMISPHIPRHSPLMSSE